jgi:hypothetical protein
MAVRGVNWALKKYAGTNIDSVANIPGLGFADPTMPAVSRLDDLLYGVTGYEMPIVGGDEFKRQKLAINILQGQIRDGFDPSMKKAVADMRDSPWWSKYILEPLGVESPEAIFSGVTKTLLPTGGLYYMPKKQRDMIQAQAEYWKIQNDPQAILDLYKKYPDFAKVQKFYNMSAKEREEYILKPGNRWILPYTQSKYNYDGDGGMKLGDDKLNDLRTRGVATPDVFIDRIQQKADSILKHAKRSDAERDLKSTVKGLNAQAKDLALKIAGGRNAHYRRLMEKWDDYQATVDKNGVKHYHTYWPFEKLEHPKELEAAFTRKYGSDTALFEGMTTEELQNWEVLSGKLPGQDRASLERDTPYRAEIDAFRKKRDDSIRYDKVDEALVGYWDLGAVALQKLGFKQADAATEKRLDAVVSRYEDKVKPIGKKYGYSSSEYKAARNSFIVWKDKYIAGAKSTSFLSGGVAERLEKTGVLTDPHLPDPTDDRRVPQQYIVAQKAMKLWEKDSTTVDKIVKYVSALPQPARENFNELFRAESWRWVMKWGAYYRKTLRAGGSQGWVGSSPESKVGEATVDAMRKSVIEVAVDASERVRKATGSKKARSMKTDIEDYFGDLNLAGYMLDWTL